MNAAHAIRVYNVEHKTTVHDISDASHYWRRLILDGQVSTYQVGVRALGYEPVGTIYDVIRKVALRPSTATPVEARDYTKMKDKACPECKKKNATPGPHQIEIKVSTKAESEDAVESTETDAPIVKETRIVECRAGRVVTDPGNKLYASMREFDETAEEFRERVRLDIGTNPDKYYRRGEIVRLPEEETEAARDTWEVARQLRESQLEDRWPRNPEACDSYNTLCSYFAVCTREASIGDPLRYRDADTHEELLPTPAKETASDPSGPAKAKRRLPLVTVSSMKAYRSCQRKYFYGYELRRRSIGDSEALRFGTLVHAGLEVWWKTVDFGAALDAMRALYVDKKIDPFDAVKAEELMRGYHVRWSDAPFTVVGVEREFRTELVNPKTGASSKTWELGGKIDAIVMAPEAMQPSVDTAAA